MNAGDAGELGCDTGGKLIYCGHAKYIGKKSAGFSKKNRLGKKRQTVGHRTRDAKEGNSASKKGWACARIYFSDLVGINAFLPQAQTKHRARVASIASRCALIRAAPPFWHASLRA